MNFIKKLLPYLLISIAAFTVAVYRVTYTQAEDMGFFLSISKFVANGQALYAEAFEIKDPLFFYTAALSMNLWGIKGPFYLDVLLITAAGAISYAAARGFKFNPTYSAVSSLIFVIVITGSYYQSFRTTLFAIVLLVLSYAFASRNMWILAGFTMILVAGMKLPYVLLGVPFLLLIFWRRTPIFKKTLSFISGLIIGASALLGILWARGELTPYFESIRENFSYASSYQEVTNKTPGISGHIESIIASGVPFFPYLIFVAVISFFAITIQSDQSLRQISLVLSLLSFATIFLLCLMTMWPHHLHPLSIVAWAICLLAFSALSTQKGPESPDLTNSDADPTSRELFRPRSVLITILTIFVVIISGFSNNFQFQNMLQGELNEPEEVSALQTLEVESNMETSIARLGPNDDLGLGAFLPNYWRLACPRWDQVGYESQDVMNQLAKCVDEKPNFLVISPGFYALQQGKMEDLRRLLLPVISNNFDCVDVPPRAGSQVCIRKK